MKAKNILMSILLVMGSIAAKAATGYPPELALVSQPVMVYNANSITVYYDVENIGDYTYKGSVYLYLDPDEGYYYAKKCVKVRPGRIKRIAIDIPAHRIRRGHTFMIMPYYEMGDELFSFTTFEYFEPISFCWNGPRNESWVVVYVGPCPRYYHRPGHYRYYYDGFRPPMPPPGHKPHPMDPHHHTYGYHHDNGGYPGNHFDGDHGPKPNDNNGPKPNDNGGATVRPNENAGSMSHSNSNSGTSTGSATNGSNSSVKPNDNNGTSTGSATGSGRTPNSGSNVSRPNSDRPSGTSSGTSTGRRGNSGSSNSRVNSGSNSSSSSSSGRTGNNNSGSSRVNNGSSSTRSSGTSSSGSGSTRGSNSSSSSRNSGSSSSRSSNGGTRGK